LKEWAVHGLCAHERCLRRAADQPGHQQRPRRSLCRSAEADPAVPRARVRGPRSGASPALTRWSSDEIRVSKA